MRYLLLIYADESHYPRMSAQETEQLMAEYGEFTTNLRQAGSFVAADRLQPTASATTVQVRKGEKLTTDGPFAETKEQLGGFYLIDVRDLDEALAWAAKVPTAKYGSIEVRPMWQSAP